MIVADRVQIGYAKTVCAGCGMREACLELAVPSFGVYGGLSVKERTIAGRRGPTPGKAPIHHGTERGYHRCYKRPEGACRPCKAAHAARNPSRAKSLL